MPNALSSVQSDQYPIFLTVKKLVYMLDACLTNSFFAWNPDGSIFGSENTTEWHNESKNGAFMINRYLKEDYNFGESLKKLGKTIITNEELDRKNFFDEEGLTDEENEEEGKD